MNTRTVQAQKMNRKKFVELNQKLDDELCLFRVFFSLLIRFFALFLFRLGCHFNWQ